MIAGSGVVFGRQSIGRSLRLGVSAACLAVAMVMPAGAATNDLGGANLTGANALNALVGYDAVTNGSLNLNPAGTLTYNGGFNTSGGPFALTKSGTGTLVLAGAGLSDYAGNTTLSGGTLKAGGTNVLSPFSLVNSASAGTLDLAGYSQTVLGLAGSGAVINSGGAATLTLGSAADSSHSGAISGAIAIVKNGSGTQTFSGNNSYTGGTTVNAGTLRFNSNSAFGSGDVVFAGGTELFAGSANRTVSNNLVFNGDVLVTGSTTLAGTISGNGRLIKSTTGTLFLTGDNSFSGGIELNRGGIYVGGPTALGTGTLVTTANTFFGVVNDASVTINNAMTLGGNFNIQRGGPGQVITLNGTISDTPTLTGSVLLQVGDGTVVVNGANSYSGFTRVGFGTFGFGNDLAAGTSRITATNGDGGLAAYADNLSIANRIFTGKDLPIDTRGYDMTLTGVIQDSVQGVLTIPGGIRKLGDGTLTLTADNTYTDATNIDGGTLRLLGSVVGNVNVNNGGTLAGTGSVGGTVFVADGGTVSPGSSPGTLTLGGLSLSSGSFLNFELSVPNTLNSPLNDLIQVNGDLVLDGALNLVGGALPVGAYRLINYTGSLTDNGLVLGTVPPGFDGVVQTGIGGQVNLVLTLPGTLLQYWDGTDFVGNGTIDGGNGVWKANPPNNTNWTGPAPSAINMNWVDGSVAVFAGATGTVTLDSTFTAQGLQFTTDNYVLQNGGLNIASGGMWVSTEGVTATISSAISGSGKLTKQGSGTLRLFGINSYLGGTDIEAGTVVVDNFASLGVSGQVRLFSGATLANLPGTGVFLDNNLETLGNGLINASSPFFELAGEISGAGSISQIGNGILALRNGDNSFVNLGINSGTVALGATGAAGAGGIAINNNATLGFYADGIVVNNTITTTGNGLISTGVVGFPIYNGYTTTINGNIGGTGSITKLLAGNLILNGNNSFVNLGITEGTVTLGTNTAAGVGGIAMFNNTTLAAGVSGLVIGNGIQTLGNGLVDQGTGTFTLKGDIAGPGSISAVGTGNLVLNGNNSFVNLGINQGTVTVGTSTAAGVGSIAINNNATLAAGANGLVLANGIVTTANGLVNAGGAGNVFTLNGNIGGPGSISQVGAGTLVLNGNNSFTNLGINNGKVVVGTNTAAGIGGIALFNNTTLAAGTSGLVLANGIQTLGNGLVDQGSGTFTLNGNIGGPGSISAIGTGNLVLNGNNSFVNLGINQGTVTVGSDTAAGSGSIAINSNATLANNKTVTLANGVVTTGNGLINVLGGTLLTLNGNVGGPGSISQVGTGNLVLNGNNSFTNLGINQGTVTVGSNTAAGVGSIALNSNATLANNKDVALANGVITTGNGLVDVLGGTKLTLNGNVTGPGSISQVGAGTLVLNGNNSFTNLGINAGTVAVGSNTAAGIGTIAINNNATLAAAANGVVLINSIFSTANGIIDAGPAGNVFTLNGNIYGPGSISQVGLGNLVLNGTNSYTNLGINAGTVTIGNATAVGNGAIAINNNATLAAGANGIVLTNAITTTANGIINAGPAGNVFTLNGNINGAGSISQVGAGNLVLNGNNSFVNLGINNGTVTLGTNTAAGKGAIALNNAVLAAGVSGLNIANVMTTTGTGSVNSGPGVLTLSGVIDGAGGITKTGSGQLNLTAASTYSGPTTVTAGTLNVTGSIARSATVVQTGTSLTGNGAVGSLTVQAGGRVSPGTTTGGPGTLTANGALTLAAGSTTVIDAYGDLIRATGPASLNGTLIINPVSGGYKFGDTVIISSSGRTGQFATTTFTGSFGSVVDSTIGYNATSVFLRLAPGSLVKAGGTSLTENEYQVASAFDAAAAKGKDLNPFFALYNQGSNLNNALNQLSGELHSAERRVLVEDTRIVRETAFDRLNAGLSAIAGNQEVSRESGGGEVTFWLRGEGTWGNADSDGNGSSFNTNQWGVLTGIDYARDGYKVGAMFTYTSTNIAFVELGTSTVETTGGAIYGGYRADKGFAVGLGGAYAGNNAKGTRGIGAPGLQQTLQSSIDGTSYQVFGEIAYDLAASPNTRIEPFVRAAYAGVKSDSFRETGGIAAIAADEQSNNVTLVTLGLRGGWESGGFRASASAGWQYATGDLAGEVTSTIAALDSLMAIQTVPLDQNSAALEFQASYGVTDKVRLGVGYSGIIGANNSSNSLRGTLSVAF